MTSTTIHPPIPHDCYGWHARIDYLRDVIESECERAGTQDITVLDVGCGTGDLLTVPLAVALPNVTFLGVDTHDETVNRANLRYESVPNLTFACRNIFDEMPTADVIICSEVLEHIDDYAPFFDRLIELLAPAGTLAITVPNGRGPAELQRRVWVRLFEKTGLLNRVRRRRSRASEDLDRSSCFLTDESPHVNFFKSSELHALAVRGEVDMSPIVGRCFLAGPFLAPVLRGRRLSELNQSLARRVPHQIVSSWMFTMRRPDAPAA